MSKCNAAALASAFLGGDLIEALPDPPRTLEQAYATQRAMVAAIGKPVIGYKLGSATKVKRAARQFATATVGPLLSGMVVPGETVFPSRRFQAPEVEAEIAFQLKDPISDALPREEVVHKLAGFRIAIEVLDSRYRDHRAVPPLQILADLNRAGALVVSRMEHLTHLNHVLTGEVRLRLGDGTLLNALPEADRPDPLAGLVFLARFMAERGETLPEGTIVTTGSHTPCARTGPGCIALAFATCRVEARLSEPRGGEATAERLPTGAPRLAAA